MDSEKKMWSQRGNGRRVSGKQKQRERQKEKKDRNCMDMDEYHIFDYVSDTDQQIDVKEGKHTVYIPYALFVDDLSKCFRNEEDVLCQFKKDAPRSYITYGGKRVCIPTKIKNGFHMFCTQAVLGIILHLGRNTVIAERNRHRTMYVDVSDKNVFVSKKMRAYVAGEWQNTHIRMQIQVDSVVVCCIKTRKQRKHDHTPTRMNRGPVSAYSDDSDDSDFGLEHLEHVVSKVSKVSKVSNVQPDAEGEEVLYECDGQPERIVGMKHEKISENDDVEKKTTIKKRRRKKRKMLSNVTQTNFNFE